MIVDSSALVAIVNEEVLAAICLDALLASRTTRISAANYVEAAIVVDRLPNPAIAKAFDDLFARLRIIIEPVTGAQASIARNAYQRFGRGSGHPAKLNFADCFAYALAKAFDEPLLYVGNDFVHTDVRRALN